MIKTDICVIGGGSGGLSVAAGAVQMGASVVLCESGKMGGDCLNYGCVPSKAMIEASRVMHQVGKAKGFGIDVIQAEVDYKKVQQHVKNVIAKIEPHDSVERFESLGVKVIQHHAELVDRYTVKADDQIIKAKYIVLATGSRANIPPIKGLDVVKYYTNENIFDLDKQPEHLLVIGGGPIGVELAQAHALLGSKVTIIEVGENILAPVDSDARDIVLKEFECLGIDVVTNANIQSIQQSQGSIEISFGDSRSESGMTKCVGSHLLIAAGRKPNIESLGLDTAGVNSTQKSIVTDNRLRTNHKNVFAIGDIAGPFQFTHAAGYQAGIVIQNILFKLPVKVSYKAFPWSVYTTPEISHVGMSMSDAEKQGAKILEITYNDNDRAQAGLATNGLVKVAVDKKGYILGATIIGENAGDLITQWTIAINNKLKIKAMASHIVAYPSLSELNKRVAGSYFTPTLYSEKVRKVVMLLMKIFGKKI
ncbi:MAG: pyruvate/2-oxoglutarate dehydrogenase complex dihydrolipoamide dehydrogenase (E3) component [Francisella sp.]|jgi:pyruvate/2-oxoglutarate dehydrogenase complex dihydrolipoamide dehydrogenase (E3) component